MGAAPGKGLAHLGWGAREREFALAYWRSELSLRPALTELWRALGDAGSLRGDALERALRGGGTYARKGALCGRLVRVLSELGLAEYDLKTRTCRAREATRTELDRSHAQRAYAQRLAAAERNLAGEPAGRLPGAVAHAG